MWSILKSQKGISMVESLIGFGILGVTGVFVMNVMSQGSDNQNEINLKQTLLKTRSSTIQTLRSFDAISNTAKMNGIDCLETSIGCSAHDYVPISLVDGNGVKFTDKANEAYGFSPEGKSCTTFPSKACPFKYTIKLKTICADSSCLIPQFKFQGELKLDRSLASVPVKNFEFEITAGQAIDSYERSCTSLGGTYQPGTPPSCLLPMNGNCQQAPNGAFQAVVGYNKSSNQKICKSVFKDFLNGKSCAVGEECSASNPTGTPGEVMMGVDSSGNPICVPMRLNPGCATLCDSSPGCVAYRCQQDPSLCPPAPPEPATATDGASDSGSDGGCGGSDGGAC